VRPGHARGLYFWEKTFDFDHERVPERVVHARGYGAHGYPENYEPLTSITRADLFSEAGLRTEAFVRFSTVAATRARLIWPATCAVSHGKGIQVLGYAGLLESDDAMEAAGP
jgi:hypothetical protein